MESHDKPRFDVNSTPPIQDDAAELLHFVGTHEVLCPVCKYNLYKLSVPRCPECGRSLKLTVGAVEPFMAAWITLATSTFASSGIAVLLDSFYMLGNLGPPLRGVEFVAWWNFTLSIPMAIAVVIFRRRLLRANPSLQWTLAMTGMMTTVAQIAFFVSNMGK